MESTAVYNSTTVPAGGAQNRRAYMDNISYASLNPKRCCNVVIVVVGILAVLAGLSLILYGSLYYISVRDPDEFETPMERRRREESMLVYQILLFVGIPVLVLGCVLWIAYLYRTGRCSYCPLCPGARRRRRAREYYEAQRIEADNISNGYSTHPTTMLPLDEQDRLVKLNRDEYSGLEDTDAMLMAGTRPVLVPMQTTI
ncbi:uncharacterized protein LOC119095922 [Pollicipes pollicipes]|uniref:uncharacterized protein LOC119095922 n=1 Tax=Pollicipes pollicipes TaxID=41117 RepID=UPI0018855299|nr:uncharacterized protein LOC119095922 [Pollicipes pollicipes]